MQLQLDPNIECRDNAVPLALFVREILRRSRTSCSTLQAALLYCSRCKDSLHELVDKATSPSSHAKDSLWLLNVQSGNNKWSLSSEESFRVSLPSVTDPCAELITLSGVKCTTLTSGRATPMRSASPLLCGRRMFLAAIVVASKFLQDRTYSNRTWSKISGLGTQEIDQLERVFLKMIRYDLVVNHAQWMKWTAELSSPHVKSSCITANTGQSAVNPTISFSPPRLHRVTSENVIGQALQFDSLLNEPQHNMGRGKRAFLRHGSSW